MNVVRNAIRRKVIPGSPKPSIRSTICHAMPCNYNKSLAKTAVCLLLAITFIWWCTQRIEIDLSSHLFRSINDTLYGFSFSFPLNRWISAYLFNLKRASIAWAILFISSFIYECMQIRITCWISESKGAEENSVCPDGSHVFRPNERRARTEVNAIEKDNKMMYEKKCWKKRWAWEKERQKKLRFDRNRCERITWSVLNENRMSGFSIFSHFFGFL